MASLSIILNFPSASRDDNIIFNAYNLIFLFNPYLLLLSFGPWAFAPLVLPGALK